MDIALNLVHRNTQSQQRNIDKTGCKGTQTQHGCIDVNEFIGQSRTCYIYILVEITLFIIDFEQR